MGFQDFSGDGGVGHHETRRRTEAKLQKGTITGRQGLEACGKGRGEKMEVANDGERRGAGWRPRCSGRS